MNFITDLEILTGELLKNPKIMINHIIIPNGKVDYPLNAVMLSNGEQYSVSHKDIEEYQFLISYNTNLPKELYIASGITHNNEILYRKIT